jgi:hypothetical protein
MKYDWYSLNTMPPRHLKDGVLTSDLLLTLATRGKQDKQPYQLLSLARLVGPAWIDDGWPYGEIQVDHWTWPTISSTDPKREGDDVYLLQFEGGRYGLTWYREAGVRGAGTDLCPYSYHEEEWLDTESMGPWAIEHTGYSLVELPSFARNCLKG